MYGMAGNALAFRVIRSKAWWALCLPVGAFGKAPLPTLFSDAFSTDAMFDLAESLGFTLRFTSKYAPDSVIMFAIQQLFIVCAPAAFLAFNYIVYGRLIAYIGAGHSMMKPQRVAKIFVISDVITFLIQVRIDLLNRVHASHEIHPLIVWRKWPYDI